VDVQIDTEDGDVHSMTHDLMTLNKLKDDAGFVTPVT